MAKIQPPKQEPNKPKYIKVVATRKLFNQRIIEVGEVFLMDVNACVKNVRIPQKNQDDRYDFKSVPALPKGVECLEVLPKGATIEDLLTGKVKSLGQRKPGPQREQMVYGGAKKAGSTLPPPDVLDNPPEEEIEALDDGESSGDQDVLNQ